MAEEDRRESRANRVAFTISEADFVLEGLLKKEKDDMDMAMSRSPRSEQTRMKLSRSIHISLIACFSAFLLFCFSAFVISCFSAFPAFPAFPAFLLFCFLLFCFSLLTMNFFRG